MIRHQSHLLGAVSAAALLASFGIAGSAQAQAQAPASSDVSVVEEVVVTGFREAYADAVRTKRNTLEITDGISSEGLDRFPDLNIGEAIQRIPGVQINREAGNRDATINLRGLPGSFALTTINGQSFATPTLGGSTPLGAFNSDIFSAVRIIKSQTAAEQPGGLSGNIDLRINPALSRRDGGSVEIGNEYNELGELNTPNATLSYNRRLTDDIAVFGVIAYKEERFRRDSVQIQNWDDRLAASHLGLTAAQFATQYPVSQYPNGIRFPGQVRQIVKDNQGETYTGAAGAEWQVNDQLKLGVAGYFSDRKLSDSNQYLQYVDPTSNSRLSNLGEIFFVEEPDLQGQIQRNAYFNSYDFTNATVTDSLRSAPLQQTTHGVTADIEWKNDTWRLLASAHTSSAENRQDQLSIDIVQSARSGGATNGISGSYSASGDDLTRSILILNTPNASHIAPGPYDQRPGTSVTQARNAGNDRFGVTGTNGRAVNDIDSVQASAERFLSGGLFDSFKFGARYERYSYVSSGTRNTAQGINFANINSALSITNPYVGTFGGGDVPGYNPNWVAVDIPAVLAALTPVTLLPGQTLTPYGLVNNDADEGFGLYNFSLERDISSAFLVGLFETEVAGFNIRGNIGGRFESTDQVINTLDTNNETVRIPGSTSTRVVTTRTPRTYRQSYDNFLPSAVVRIDLTDEVTLRLAAYDTFVRPNPRDISPATVITDPPEGTTDPTYSVRLGSPDLKPYTAHSYDAALEWYNRPGGLVALTFFRKDVEDFVGAIRDPAKLCPPDATALGLGNLSIVGNVCYSDIQVDIGTPGAPQLTPVRVVMTGNENQQPLTVNGVEFNVQQNLDFLPAPFDKLGGSFNYAYTSIDGTNTDGMPLTLAGVSKHNVNLIGYYETSRFGFRAVYNYRDDYDLAAGGTFSGDARAVRARGQLDLAFSLNLPRQMKLNLNAFNVTDAKRHEYENDYLKPRQVDVDGRTYQISISGRF